ncbi:MAG: response regulator [Bacteroidetes bacterium]|nr:response regulator [Bacteroidota bacterium]
MEQRPTILIIEDDAVQLEMLAELLKREERYTIFTATNTKVARQLLREHTIDLIVSDNYMEGETGYEFCRSLKQEQKHQSIMFMLLTAEQRIDHKIRALDHGADDYISKPYHPDEFLSRVRVLLRLKKLQDDLAKESQELRNAIETLNANFEGVVNLLTKLIALRIPNAAARGAEAARLCRWMAERFGIEQEGLVLIDLAARFHEIGKITLPDELLHRQFYELGSEERQRIVESGVVGEMIVSGIPQFKNMGSWLRHQMENYDGSGYPDKLAGEEIPLEARLLRAVNLLESIPPQVLSDSNVMNDILLKARNTILDPRIVQLLQEYLLLHFHPSWIEGKKQINVMDLREGMVLAADLSTGSGKKLLPKDTRITKTIIERILSQHHFDPIIGGIYIYKESET